MSADFNRCVLEDFIGVLTACYNQEDFQIYCFANGKIDDVTEFYQSCPVEWVDITGLNAPDASRAIYSREIDILFDLRYCCSRLHVHRPDSDDSTRR